MTFQRSLLLGSFSPSLTFLGMVYISEVFASETFFFSGDIPLAVVYFWSLFLPGALSPWVVVGAGLFLDICQGSWLGLHGILFLGVMGFCHLERKRFLNESFWVIWLGFLLVLLCSFFLKFFSLSLALGRFYPLKILVMEGVVSFLCFPLIARICLGVYGRILDEQKT